jgi:hypothetical protein
MVKPSNDPRQDPSWCDWPDDVSPDPREQAVPGSVQADRAEFLAQREVIQFQWYRVRPVEAEE